MPELTAKTTMRDVWNAWNNLEQATARASARLCEVICAWKDSGAITHEDKPAETGWATYLAGCFKISKARVYQLEAGGRAARELSTIVDTPKLLGAMGEGHLRPLAPFAEDPEMLEETWKEVEANLDDNAKKYGRVRARDVKKAVEMVQKRYDPSPGWTVVEDEVDEEDVPAPVYRSSTVGTPLQRARDGLMEVIENLGKAAANPPEDLEGWQITAEADGLKPHLKVIKGWAAK